MDPGGNGMSREQQIQYLKEQGVVGEVDRALEGLLKAAPAQPVAWLARHFSERAAELGQQGPAANSVSGRNPSVIPGKETLLNRIGGSDEVRVLVSILWTKLVHSPETSSFTRKLNASRMSGVLHSYFVHIFSEGDVPYRGRSLAEAHRSLVESDGLNRSHFQAFMQAARETVQGHMDVAPAVAQDVFTLLESLQQEVLGGDHSQTSPTTAGDGDAAAAPQDGGGVRAVAFQDDSLFRRLGGLQALEGITAAAFVRIGSDETLAPFFSGVSGEGMNRVRRHFTDYLAMQAGGPSNYTGRGMRESHLDLVVNKGLSSAHIDTLLEHLGHAMLGCGVEGDDIDDTLACLEGIRTEVLCLDMVPKKQAPRKSLFAELGAVPAMEAAMDELMTRLCDDSLLVPFFERASRVRFKTMLESFLTAALGGPDRYNGKSIREAHARFAATSGRQIDEAHFEAFVRHLLGALETIHASAEIMEIVEEVCENNKDDVICEDLKKNASREQSIYTLMGGERTVEAAVDLLYTKVLGDARVSGFFTKEGVRMVKLKAMQREFLTAAFGGQQVYSGRDMREAHRSLVEKDGLNGSHFDVFIEHLGDSLAEISVHADLVAKAVVKCSSMRRDVFGGLPAAEAAHETLTLFDRMGGDEAITRLVNTLHTRILSDPRINFFFNAVKEARLKQMQTLFFALAFGGPNNYPGRSMRDAHASLVATQGLDATHFEVFMEHVHIALQELALTQGDMEDALTALKSLKTEVLEKPKPVSRPLYERLGGASALRACVELFHQRLLGDARLAGFFKGVDTTKLKRMQEPFITFAFGGPNKYSGRGMRSAHRRLVKEEGLNDTHFDMVVEHMGEALKDIGAKHREVGDAVSIANSVRNEVLCKGEDGPVPKPLFDRLGGAGAVEAAVDLFYKKVLSDPRISPFFDGIDMRRQKASQRSFLTYAFGGPNNYSGAGMRKAHATLVQNGLNDKHFDAVIEHLGATLKELGVAPSDIADAAKVAESVRGDVLGKDAGAQKPLFDRLGGAGAVEAAVDLFYKKVLSDPRISPFFDGIDMRRQKASQRSFLTYAFGGPNNYSGAGMRKAHATLVQNGLNDKHFDAVIEHLGATLKELGVAPSDIADAAKVAESVRGDVLGKDAGAQKPLFDRLGGAGAVEAAVDLFYKKVLSDPRISPFFDGIDMRRQKASQRSFLTYAFGGPNNYSGAGMRKAHATLVQNGLNDKHFDAVIEHLGATLKELGVAPSDIADAAKVAESVRGDVLGKDADAQKPLFDRLGGAGAVEAAVDLFYKKVLADPRISPFFDGIDMRRQKASQRSFLTYAFGGPNNYSGAGMRKAHATLVQNGLNDKHFDAVIEHLGATLKELGVAPSDIADAAKVAESVRGDVLGKDADAQKPLFDRLGGAGAVEAAVDLFYKKVLADPRISPFFDSIDMRRQKASQRSFLTYAFGGPNNYSGAGMRKAHATLVQNGLNDKHFDAVIEHLGATLKELGVAPSDIADAAKVAESVRGDVLGKDADAQKPLFDRLGGAGAVEAAVDLFYKKVLADPRISPFFDGIDMRRQKASQRSFFTYAFGGPNNYSGAGMRKAHATLVQNGLNDKHFDAVIEHLGATLKELGVAPSDIADAAKVAESVRGDVLGKDADAQKPLFDRLGGAGAVEAAVDLFYKKVLSDPRISPFFDGIDMRRQKASQRSFLTYAFGGPNNYSGAGMRKAHATLVQNGLNDKHFDAVIEHLGATLKELGVAPSDIADAAKVAESVRGDVLGKDADAQKPLFDRLGGAGAVEAAVDLFYKKVLADPRISPFFDGIDMRRQKASQRSFLTYAFGGPNNYSGAGMRKAHATLVQNGLNDKHFDAVIEHLGATLKELGVAPSDIADAAKVAESVRGDVLGKDADAQKPLFDRLGGAGAVEAAVDLFYKKVLADPRISPFFDGIDMCRQKASQRSFLTYAFGGPNNYSGAGMRKAHATLVQNGLNDKHFDAVIEHLGATLKELGVAPSDIADAAKVAESVRGDVLGKDATPAPPQPSAVAHRVVGMLNADFTTKLSDVRSMLSDASRTDNDCEIFTTLGEAKVGAIVTRLFELVCSDALLAPFFQGVMMPALRSTFRDFLASVWGDEMYLGKNMRAAHSRAVGDGFNDDMFDLFLAKLKIAMEENSCTSEVVAEGLQQLNLSRDDILCKPE